MRTFRSFLIVCGILAGSLSLLANDQKPVEKSGANEKALIGPFVYKNLEIYLIQGKETMPNVDFLTLEEAMKQKILVVHETGDVNKLAVQNVSATKTVFIQAGEIVKGGKQDRTLMTDLIVKPKSGKVNLAAYCVEQGRWQKRGMENLKAFSGSSKMVFGKGLRKALKESMKEESADTNSAPVAKKQGEIWKEVAKSQKMMGMKMGTDVTSKLSSSSLQLTLENKKLKVTTKDYTDKLKPILKKYPKTIGFGYMVNGKFSTADSYGSRKLFRKIWPKLLDAAVTEAITDTDKKYKNKLKDDAGVDSLSKSIGKDAAKGWMGALFVDGHVQAKKAKSEKYHKRRVNVNKQTKVDVNEHKDSTNYDTLDIENNEFIHRNWEAN
ncbi:MAG: hypothetical protein HRT89_09585 [Lentisphaeria bacterium]|nr:hypothetical protein [Lentisphaeria bacterium]NQZ68312.1 hypothetical protein [Lentisphaeria bacterium]